MSPSEESKSVQDELVGALLGEVSVEDAMPKDQTLEEHDKQHHPDGYHEGDTCKFRDKVATETEPDKADLANPNVAPKGDVVDKGTSKKQIVTPEEDAAYMEAVEKGDMETAAKMVRNAAAKVFPNTKIVDSDGKPLIVWHATGWNPYDEANGKAVFDDTKVGTAHDKGWFGHGFYFGRSKNAVRQYLPYKDDKYFGNILPFFINIKNPCIKPYGGFDSDNAGGYDGIIVGGDKYYEKPYDDPINWCEFVAFYPNQIKSANPVTYDDAGNIIPLSRRFDNGDDIRGDVNGGSGEGENGTSSSPHQEENYLETAAAKVKRFIPGVEVEISDRPFSAEGNPEVRKAVRVREHLRWVRCFEDFLSGKIPRYDKPHLVMEHTPEIWQHFGAKDLPIKVSGEVIEKIIGERPNASGVFHETPREQVNTWLYALDRPLAIFAHDKDRDKIVVLTKMMDHNPTREEVPTNDIVPIVLDAKNTKGEAYNSHMIASAFGQYRDKIKEWTDKGYLRYVDTEHLPRFAPWFKMPENLKEQGIATQKDFPEARPGQAITLEEEMQNPALRMFLDDEGVVVGTYNRQNNKVTLFPGANADTIAHELCGHATWQYAEQQAAKGDKRLLDKMNEVVDSKTAKPVWDEVAANYEGENHDVQREEVWAHIVGHKGSVAIEDIRKTEKGKKWYQRAWGVVKDAWKGLMSAAGLNRVKTDGIENMSPEEFSDYMVKQMTEGRTLGKVEKDHSGGERKSISKIYTGSSADYDKPSLQAVGSGEGAQVYGWGLYGSTERGVAETYAHDDSLRKTGLAQDPGYDMPDNGFPQWAIDSARDRLRKHGWNKNSREKAISEVSADIDKHKSLGHDKFAEGLGIVKDILEKSTWHDAIIPNGYGTNNYIYEQTFFTDRAPSDESHLLKWYEPLSDEQFDWIETQIEEEPFRNNIKYLLRKSLAERRKSKSRGRTGQQVYSAISNALNMEPSNGEKSKEQVASEFLSRANIDGIKYPVDSYGGKGVKDGDKVGWNYVSFRDDNIRIDKKYVDGQKVYDYQELMAKRNPNVDSMEVLSKLSKLGSREEMAAEFKRIMEGETLK